MGVSRAAYAMLAKHPPFFELFAGPPSIAPLPAVRLRVAQESARLSASSARAVRRVKVLFSIIATGSAFRSSAASGTLQDPDPMKSFRKPIRSFADRGGAFVTHALLSDTMICLPQAKRAAGLLRQPGPDTP
jgi:hypothetical protein